MLGHRVLGMGKGGGDVLLVEPGAVIAFDPQRHAAARGQMSSPAERGVEGIKFLEQHSFPLQRRNRR